MRVRLKHITRYGYDEPAAFGPHIVRLHPAQHTRTHIASYSLAVAPECTVHWQQDPWGNRIARLSFPARTKARELVLTVDAALDVRPVNPFDFFIDDRCRELPFAYPDGLTEELTPFARRRTPGPRLAEWLRGLEPAGNTVDWLVALNQKAASTVRYLIRQEAGIQSSEETLAKASGSCRDIAALLVDAIRASGLAARFVSGYLVQLMDEGIIPDLPKGVTRDVVDLHAWAEVYLPGAGWLGIDGTSGLLCGEGHIPLACTVHPELAAPVAGTSSQQVASFHFDMQVERVGHEPSPRRPYTDEQWAEIQAAGRAVDVQLARQGIALTMGGEPTWTSREHPREPEWLTEAVGPTKRSQGLRFARELKRRLSDGALVMERMGKLYPGESLPRWAVDVIWRRDGFAVWRDPRRLGVLEEAHDLGDRAALKGRLDSARALAGAIAARLGLRDPDQAIHTAYEDPWRAVLDEDSLPVDVDPLRADLDDGETRRRLARVLARGLGTPVGFALPLARPWRGAPWLTCRWTFRRGQLLLVPGDSPMGLRLPLDRLGGQPLEVYPLDVTTGAPPLPLPSATAAALEPIGAGAASGVGAGGSSWQQPRFERSARFGEGLEPWPPSLGPSEQSLTSGFGWGPGGPGGSGGPTIRGALCVEPRREGLFVFVPPLPSADDFVELVAAIEDAATALDLVVRIEGYPPERDPRLQHCVVTPDPGVIELNLPVTGSFPEYIRVMEIAAAAANHAGLHAERYQLDGREVGSGGGHHLTLGGPTTVESPFLKRPDLLASLLRYTQNHPSLSYLFSGLFVGPTSQAPRIDEARHDALYELELALARVPTPGSGMAPPPPWLVDRLFRNLLVDVAGNTHRAEVSIDKLYSPDGLAGRMGILELRAFEMPPHERMAVAQMLLVRALVARFANEPYTRPLIRWGTELHDRFMLPHYLWQDLLDVIEDVRRSGLGLDAAWYQPFLDYRFPVMGAYDVDGIHLEVRDALEPWPVLGEEPTGATVSRYVDSSLERVQVRVDGLTEGRHRVLVNGLLLPLRRTGKAGERVAGVRFRAWQPPHCLQPGIGIHHPLRFDIVDTWGKRSLGACTYHVWHPEGRGFDQVPLTPFEAAARRARRFTVLGHAPWPVEAVDVKVHPEGPWTLDLRRFSIDRPMPRTDLERAES